MKLKIFLTLLLSLVIVACSTKPKEVYVVEYEFLTYDIPSVLTTKCIPPRPLEPNKYNLLTDGEKETYLAKYVITLLGEVKKCDNKITAIKTYVDKQNKLLSDYSGDAKGVK